MRRRSGTRRRGPFRTPRRTSCRVRSWSRRPGSPMASPVFETRVSVPRGTRVNAADPWRRPAGRFRQCYTCARAPSPTPIAPQAPPRATRHRCRRLRRHRADPRRQRRCAAVDGRGSGGRNGPSAYRDQRDARQQRRRRPGCRGGLRRARVRGVTCRSSRSRRRRRRRGLRRTTRRGSDRLPMAAREGAAHPPVRPDAMGRLDGRWREVP